VKMNVESQLLISESQKIEHEASIKNQEMMENLEELKAVQEEAENREKQIIQMLEETRKKEVEIESKLKESEENKALALKQLAAAKKEVEKLKKKKI